MKNNSIKKGGSYRLNQDLPRISKNSVVVVVDIRHNNKNFPYVIMSQETGVLDVCRLGNLTSTFKGVSGKE